MKIVLTVASALNTAIQKLSVFHIISLEFLWLNAKELKRFIIGL